jgi:hypothetical protein
VRWWAEGVGVRAGEGSGAVVLKGWDLVKRQEVKRRLAGAPLLAFSLLRYENKTTVLHFNIQRWVGVQCSAMHPCRTTAMLIALHCLPSLGLV